MNDKAVTKLAVGIIIAIVLIGAFVIPLALTLIESPPSRVGANPFADNSQTSTGVLGLDFSLVNTVEVESGIADIFLEEIGPSGPGICIVTTWIQNKMNQVFGFPLVRFQEVQFAFVNDATKTVGGQALSPTLLEPGDYQFVILVNCALAVKTIDISWLIGGFNMGNSGTVQTGLLEDFDNNGIWREYELGQNALFNVNIDGTIISGEPLEPPPEPPTEPPTPPTNITENGDAGLVDTITPSPPDTTAATTQIIIGIIVLIVGIFFMGVGTRGGTVVLTVIGFILIIVGLAIIAFGAIPFFAPALAIREKKVSNMLKGSLNPDKRR